MLKRGIVYWIVFLFVSINSVPLISSITYEVNLQTELVIDGPTLIEAGYVEYDFYLIQPPECDLSLLSVDWGDNWTIDWHGPFDSSFIFKLFHDWWEGAGIYTINATVYDVEDNEYHAELAVTVLPNEGPDNPTIKKTGPHEFTFTSTDPEGDNITYCIDWGDGEYEDYEWIGPYKSGEKAVASHTWEKGGFYTIYVRSYDIHNAKCPTWGELVVFVRKNKIVNRPFLQFLQQYLNIFPILQKLFQQLEL